MALGHRVAWGYGVGAGVLVVGLLVTTPAYSAPSPGGISTSAVTPSPTPTPEPTPTPTPTPTQTPTPAPTADPDLLLPDVIALPASQLSLQSRSDGRRLRFTSSLGNVGLGPLEVRPNKNRPCPPGQHNSTQIIFRDANHNATFNARHDTEFTRHRAGCMIFHPLHNHWHFKATARYTLLDVSADNRVVVSTRRKVSFCLRDIARVPQRYGEWPYPVTYGSCSKRSPQGISVGWMDIYQSFLAGQFLRLPKNLADGRYCLETVVDPINQLAETHDDNNSSIRAFAIRKNRIVSRDRSICR